jgi:O-antigen/teichoic acid export membrane protein
MKTSLILKSVVLTWAAVLVAAIASFFLTPYILRHLGDEAYGLWVLIVALSDYYLFLQVGVRSAIVRYVSRNLALHNTEKVSRTVTTSFYFFMIAFMVVIAIASSLQHHVAGFFSVKPVNVTAFASLFLLVGIAQAFDFPLNVFEGALEAVGRFDQLYSLRITGMILRVVLIVLVLRSGGGLFGVGAATVLSTLTLRCVAVPLAFREVPGFNLHPRGIDRKLFKEMLGYGITSFTVGFGQRLSSSVSPVVIAKFLSASAVTLFSLPVKLLSVPLNGIGSMTEFANPLSSHLEALQDKAGLRRILILCGESAFLLSAPLTAFMLVFGRPMMTLWIGSRYSSTYALLVMLTIGLTAANTQCSTQSMLFGIGRHKGLVWMRLVEGIGIAALGTILIHLWGLWGYAFSMMIVSLLINLVLIPRYACKLLEMPARTYFLNGCLKPSLFSLPLVVVFLGFQHFSPIGSWAGLVTGILIGGFVYVLTLLTGVWLKRRRQIDWAALGILDLLEKRFVKKKRDLEASASAVVFEEFEKGVEQSVAD